MTRTMSAALALAAMCALPLGGAAQQKRPMTFEDFIGFPVPGAPQIAPDGKAVVYTVTTYSLKDNKGTTRIWMAPLDGGAPARELTAGPGSDSDPRWSPNGSELAFVSTRSGTPQVWVLPMAGGEARQVTDLKTGASSLVWAPDGRTIYFVSDLEWPPKSKLDSLEDGYPTDARMWDHLLYRHWNEWRSGLREHLFSVPVAGGASKDLTPWDRDVPTITLPGDGDVSVAPDGSEIAFTMNPDSVVTVGTNNDIFVMHPDGTGRHAVTTNRGDQNTPRYAPDGRYLAYLSQPTPGFEADRTHLMILDRQSGTATDLTPDWPLSVGGIVWAPDSRAIYATVEERGRVGVYRIGVPDGARTRVLYGGTVGAFSLGPQGRTLAYVHSTADRPQEIFAAGSDGSAVRQLSHLTDKVVVGLDMKPAEDFAFVGADGDSVHGFLIKPPGFDPAKKYPMVYLVHGGPQGAWLDEWHPRWNYQMFAEPGYVLAAVNFHGSTGYGQAFTNSISRHWGDRPYEDLMKGVDAVLKQYPFIDSNRMGAAGASYGGYMIYWMEGHTQRFKAMVDHDGVFNTVSMFGSTEELWFPLHEFGGNPYGSARDLYEKWSPLNFVKNWKTPMLIVHSQHDYRLDLSQGLQAFTALQQMGVPSRFLYFPDEFHFVTKPRDRRLWWATVLDWLGSYLHPEGVAGSR
ncbi:MAG: S9 family peptidase [Gemmatimonadetes bacterium]|nr:S9 family peptidase [Gemmatimonadota bacterium]